MSGLTIELLQRRLNIVLLDNFAQLTHHKGVLVRFMVCMAVFATWIVTVVDTNLVLANLGLQNFPLILLIEVDDKERVLKADEEVALVRRLFWLLFVWNRINRIIAALVLAIDLLLQLLLGNLELHRFLANLGKKQQDNTV